jgi:hypothetical protein
VQKSGDLVWMALAILVKARVGLGSKLGEQQNMALIRRLRERVRRGTARRSLLVCPDMGRLNATARGRLAPLARRSRALARRPLTRQHGMYRIGTVSHLCLHLQVCSPAVVG